MVFYDSSSQVHLFSSQVSYCWKHWQRQHMQYSCDPIWNQEICCLWSKVVFKKNGHLPITTN